MTPVAVVVYPVPQERQAVSDALPVVPEGMYLPAPQSVQEAALEVEEYFPAAQSKQEHLSALIYFPAAQVAAAGVEQASE